MTINEKTNKRPRIGLALGSGAAKGLAHIGVLKVLEREKVPIHFIAGTSAGALIGAVYASGIKAWQMEKIAVDIDRMEMARLFDPVLPWSGLIDGKKIEGFVAQVFGDRLIEDLKIPFVAIAADILTGEEVIIAKGSVVKAVRASISIPGIFTPVEFNNRLLVDGGVVDPVPTEVLRDMGMERIIAVNVIPDLKRKVAYPSESTLPARLPSGSAATGKIDIEAINLRIKELIKNRIQSTAKAIKGKIRDEKIPSIFKILSQSIMIMENEIVKSRLQKADVDVIIKPNLAHINALDFDRAEECIKEGERATEALLEQIKRCRAKLAV